MLYSSKIMRVVIYSSSLYTYLANNQAARVAIAGGTLEAVVAG